jgi:Tfp pilus assembly protein PilO
MNLNGSNGAAATEQKEDLSLWMRLRALIKDNFEQRPLVSWLILVAVVLVLYLRVADPLIEWAADTRQRAATLGGSLAGLEAMAGREEARLKKLESEFQLLQKLAASLPATKPEQAQSALAKETRKMAESQGLKVAGSLILAPKPQGSLLRVALRLTADGTYTQMRGFLSAFAKTNKFMAPASFTLSPSPEAQGKLRMECEVVTLLRRKP